LGNLGFDAMVGPGTNNWDISLQKTFPNNERFRTEFRLEMYNAFNHVNFWAVGTTFGNANFGQVTQAQDPRILQMALRLEF